MSISYRTPRQINLEAMRGLAAIAVLLHHFILAFSPETSGFLPEHRTENSLVGVPWFGLLNGKAAVYFFFVLSGYVLSFNFLKTGDFQALRNGFLKRLPRLAFPVALSCLFAFFLMKLELLFCFDASSKTNSLWLRNLGFGHNLESFVPRLDRMLIESVTVFFNGVNRYNSSLWSMKPEMTGSIIVMVLAFFYRELLGFKHLLYASVLIFLIIARLDPMLCAFLFGFYVALFQVKCPSFKLKRVTAWGFLTLGIYFCGYIAPIDAYELFKKIAISPEQFYMVGSALMLIGVVFCRQGFTWLEGGLGAFLGRQSFPTYLLHTSILGSISSYLYLQLVDHFNHIELMFLLFSITLGITVSLALLMDKVDSLWVTYLNRKF